MIRGLAGMALKPARTVTRSKEAGKILDKFA